MDEISESKEDYLKCILILSKQKDKIRSVDLANYMGFSKPSISNAIKKMSEEGYLIIDNSGFLHLTEEGFKVADRVFERHVFFENLLSSTGIDIEQAHKEADKIEHDISSESFEIIKAKDKTFQVEGEKLEEKDGWVLCPKCGQKTNLKVQKETVAICVPIICPACKTETLVSIKNLVITKI